MTARPGLVAPGRTRDEILHEYPYLEAEDIAEPARPPARRRRNNRQHWHYPSRALTAFSFPARGIFPSPATRHVESGIGATRRVEHERSSHDRAQTDEVSTMRIRTMLPGILGSAVLSFALGCSGQPTAPSTLTSPSTVGVSTTAPGGSQQTAVSPSRFGDRTPGVVYVTSQGLYYDTFVVKDPLPMEGPFQLLADGQTEFGPGQPGYLGGRWWVDSNENGMQDAEDHFFLCPLLPPGRPTP
jgi:hypothetical protein